MALQTLPKIAIAPLIIVWFGFGISSKVIIAATVAFFPVLVNVIVGLKTIDAGQARSHALAPGQPLADLPARHLSQCAALRVRRASTSPSCSACSGPSWVSSSGRSSGLGNLILQFNVSLDIAGVFAVLILLSVMGVALHLIMQAVQKHIIFWAEPDEIISA